MTVNAKKIRITTRAFSCLKFSALLWLVMPVTKKSFALTDIPTHGCITDSITVTTNFLNGGGNILLVNKDPVILRVSPHDEGGAGWGKVWFHFRIEGLRPGQEISIELEMEKDMPFEDQKTNRAAFFSVPEAKPLEQRVKGEQSMTFFHYSARSADKFEPQKGMPPQWATVALN